MTALTPAFLRQFHTRLQRWYDEHGRKSLPWRTTADPYHIYISEVMLQQTQVKTVLERFYYPFLMRFPTLAALATAPQEDVLHVWQGLGYYSRAINLHRAAQMAAPILPESVEALIALPGIGRNTAHAIAAFAHHAPVPVMEANVKRVLCRIFAMEVADETVLWERAQQLLNHKNPFDYNQAMMDIGATVCRKRAPDCNHCPANNLCAGKISPESYPASKSKKTPPVRRKRIIVLRNPKGQVFATPRTSKFLGGLYHFIELDENTNDFIYENKRVILKSPIFLGHITQKYSHFTLEAEVFLLDFPHSGPNWHGKNALAQLPVSMAEKKIIELLR